VPILCKLAVHPNREVAFQAACALGETGSKEGIPVLKNTWRSGNQLIRAASAASLKRLGARPAKVSMKAIAVGMGTLAALSAGAGILLLQVELAQRTISVRFKICCSSKGLRKNPLAPT